uniref:Phosphotransferase enzyme family protein n=1 Tax=Candidatus Kentrum sp. DK TaxID=2126562 RepID=A0A450TGM3_9GAMM|nr:MAG: Phosphotransferase enzyme family protein [Candidatus Kentron sp. DK]
MMIPILLIEDEPLSVKRAQILLREVESELHVKLDVQVSKDYREGLDKLALGTFPLVIIDLHLPDPKASAEEDVSEYPGLELVAVTQSRNKDALIGVYTAHNTKETTPEIVERHVNGLLCKNDIDDTLKGTLSKLINQVLQRFNFSIGTKVDEVLDLAFGAQPNSQEKLQWETCLRRFLRDAEEEVAYNYVGRGRSGAGVVAAYVDDFYPVILKLDHSYERLKDEATRYRQYVKRFIPKSAGTSSDDLAQAGDIGVLTYSFVGITEQPSTLSMAISELDAEQMRTAIAGYFEDNCARWYARGGGERPYDLAGEYRDRLGINKNKLQAICRGKSLEAAIKRAATHIDCSAERLVEIISDAVEMERRRIICKPYTIIHGDLNVNNLIWDGNHLWIIDFAKTGEGPRLFDFIKLEASIKNDVPEPQWNGLSDEDKVKIMLDVEDKLLATFDIDEQFILDNAENGLRKSISAIQAVRECARAQWGRVEKEGEYWLTLFFVMAKYIDYLSRDIERNPGNYMRLVNTLVSSYRLAGMIERFSRN